MSAAETLGPDITTGTDRVDFGVVEFSSTGSVTANLTRADASWVNVTNVTGASSSTPLTLTAAASSTGEAVRLPADVSELAFRDFVWTLSANGEADLYYNSTANLTLDVLSAPPSSNFYVYDLSGGAVVYEGRTSSDGSASISGLPSGARALDIRTGANLPFVTDASPISGAYDSDRNVTLSATVENPEGSDVVVDFEVYENASWATLASQQVSSGSTATAAYSAPPGERTWRVNLSSASASGSAVYGPYTFSTAGTVEILNGSSTAPSDVLSTLNGTNVTVTVQSADSDYQTTQTVAGMADLQGAPKERLVLTFDAESTFANRTLVIEDPGVNRTTHLVPAPGSGVVGSNRSFVQPFQLDDRTGLFPLTETRLGLQDYVNGKWRTVAIAPFGANNYATPVVQAGELYRLVVYGDGRTRDLGTWEADFDATGGSAFVLVVEGVDVDYGDLATYGYEWNATLVESDDGASFIQLSFATAENTVARGFNLSVYPVGNRTDAARLFFNEYGLVNNLTATVPLTDEQATQNWVVVWNARLDDGPQRGEIVVGPDRANLSVGLSPFWQQTFAAGGLIVMAGFFGGLRSSLGAVMVPLAGGVLWYIGWLPAWLGGAAIVTGLALGVLARAADPEVSFR